MFELIKKNLTNSSQPSSATKQFHVNKQHTIDVSKLIDTILSTIIKNIQENIGESISSENFQKQQVSQIKKAVQKQLSAIQSMEQNLLATKQKYNELVDKSAQIYQKSRKIGTYIMEFVMSINLFLESQELMIPMNQIQKGINELQPQRVEKQTNYLIKLFETSFDDVIQKHLNKLKKQHEQEVKSYSSKLKHTEQQLKNYKNTKNTNQSKFFDQSLKLSDLNEKVSKLEQQKQAIQKKLREQLASNRNNREQVQQQTVKIQKEYQKAITRAEQIEAKLKACQKKRGNLQKLLKQKQLQIKTHLQILSKIKQNQSEVIQQMQEDTKSKIQTFQNQLKKTKNENFSLQNKNQELAQQIKDLRQEISVKNKEIILLSQKVKQLESDLTSIKYQEPQQQNLKDDTSVIKQESLQLALKKINSKKQIQIKQENINENKSQKSGEVNKQIMRNLFLSYEDQQKQWTVRKNIKNQIYLQLGIQIKDKNKTSQQKKWFGLF